jgi:hypothetical protein
MEARFATVVTNDAYNISYSTASCAGDVIDDGGAQIKLRGICYSKTPNPDVFDASVSSGAGTGAFSIDFSSLDPSTTYYVRAFAENHKGIAYGNQISFKTLSPKLPIVLTNNVSVKSKNQFTAGGNVTDDGGVTVFSRGICWSTSPMPTVNNPNSSAGSGTGFFSATATGLVSGTLYYYRAYAQNSVGISYGSQYTVTTPVADLPTITTTAPSSINPNYASSGGYNISDGGSQITSKGVCWNTTGIPSINDALTYDGTGTSTFTSLLTGLYPGITYYVRAYASNVAGTGYGSVYTITPLSAPTSLSLDVRTGLFYYTWSCVTGATSYDIEVSTSSSFSGLTYSLNYYPGGTIKLSGVMQGNVAANCSSSRASSPSMSSSSGGAPKGSYLLYWRVRALGPNVVGPWSSVAQINYTVN